MKSNTKKFLATYEKIGEVENKEVVGKLARLNHEKELKKLNFDLMKYGSKIKETEFYFCAPVLCCSWEEFKDCYINS